MAALDKFFSGVTTLLFHKFGVIVLELARFRRQWVLFEPEAYTIPALAYSRPRYFRWLPQPARQSLEPNPGTGISPETR